MGDLIYIEPRNNPDYKFYDVLNNININFSGITSGGISVSGATENYYTTGASYNNGIIFFDRNDSLSAFTVTIPFSDYLPLSGGVLTDGLTGTTLNLNSISQTTSATTYDDLVIFGGELMSNKQFDINIFFEVTGVTYNFISPNNFKINQLVGTIPSSAVTIYNSTLSATTNVGDTINQYDQLAIDSSTTGLTIFNSQKI